MSENQTETIAVVGGGLAAGRAIRTLRENNFAGRIIVFASEQHRPYERPPLSKGYLLGNDELESAFVDSADWYDEHGVELRLATPVTSIDTAAHTVTTASGAESYDKLLITTGASPRHLPLADESGANIAYLRTIEDSERLKAALRPDTRVAIIGGGWIGLEVASAARQAGSEVTVIESLSLPLLRVLGPEVAAVFADLHTSHGVDLRSDSEIVAIEKSGDRSVVRLDDGSQVEADLIVIGIGVTPNTALAEAAGLTVDNGIVVDQELRASAPDVYAAGDVANAMHPVLGRQLRVEHWDNAIEQGATAARNLLGAHVAYDRLPYFFTDQYDLGIEYVGNVGPDGYDEVILRGDLTERVFTAFWLREGRVLAGMHCNDWDAIDGVRAVVSADEVDVEALRDSGVGLEATVRSRP